MKLSPPGTIVEPKYPSRVARRDDATPQWKQMAAAIGASAMLLLPACGGDESGTTGTTANQNNDAVSQPDGHHGDGEARTAGTPPPTTDGARPPGAPPAADGARPPGAPPAADGARMPGQAPAAQPGHADAGDTPVRLGGEAPAATPPSNSGQADAGEVPVRLGGEAPPASPSGGD